MDNEFNSDRFSLQNDEILPRKSIDSNYEYPSIPEEIDVEPEQYFQLIANHSVSRQTIEESWRARINAKFAIYPNKKFRESVVENKKNQLLRVVEAYILPFLRDPTNKLLKTYLVRLGTNDLWQDFLYSMNFLWSTDEIESSPLLFYVNIVQNSCKSDNLNKSVDNYEKVITLAIDLYCNKLHQVLVDELENGSASVIVLPPIPELEARVGKIFTKDVFGHYLCLYSLEKCLEGVNVSRKIALTYLRKTNGDTYSIDNIKTVLYRLKGKSRKTNSK
jgi:hypothetical protein